MLLMNKNVKNLKKTPFSFFNNLDVPIKVRASEFGILCSVLIEICFGFSVLHDFLSGFSVSYRPQRPPLNSFITKKRTSICVKGLVEMQNKAEVIV